MSDDLVLLTGQWVWNITLLVGFIGVSLLYACLVWHFVPKKMVHKQPLGDGVHHNRLCEG